MKSGFTILSWDEFTGYNYGRIYDDMTKPAFIFDGQKSLDHERLIDIGFRVQTIGRDLGQLQQQRSSGGITNTFWQKYLLQSEAAKLTYSTSWT